MGNETGVEIPTRKLYRGGQNPEVGQPFQIQLSHRSEQMICLYELSAIPSDHDGVA